MTVYILFNGSYENRDIWGVYSSLEDAIHAAKGISCRDWATIEQWQGDLVGKKWAPKDEQGIPVAEI